MLADRHGIFYSCPGRGGGGYLILLAALDVLLVSPDFRDRGEVSRKARRCLPHLRRVVLLDAPNINMNA